MSKNCVNTKNADFIKLQEEVGINPTVLAAKVGVWMDKNTNERFPTAGELGIDSLSAINNVNYGLKAVDILLSEKAEQIFAKGGKNKWSLDKMLTELAIPKEQKKLLLDLGITDREQLAIELASNYSYTVEINTEKNKNVSDNIDERNSFTLDGISYHEFEGVYSKFIDNNPIDISFSEYVSAKNEFNKTKANVSNSSYYSNLTSPGGTNYRELEISTPSITPSIKGHAQFATDKGIGWARVDDRAKLYYDSEIGEYVAETESTGDLLEDAFGTNRKTMPADDKSLRVLELQSDLFQKGRDKANLTEKDYSPEDWFIEEDFGFFNVTDSKTGQPINSFNTREEAQILIDKYRNKPENQFLQLLNKDSNWVTFFIKSIIQNAAKEGYEKVLFPKGETAAKIEGHETLASEIIAIDRELVKLNKDIDIYNNNIKNSQDYEYIAYLEFELTEKKKELESFIENTQGVDNLGEYEAAISKEINTMSKVIEDLKNPYSKNNNITYTYTRVEELEKQKQELKSQGIEKLKPIEAFYEIKVGNILEKQYGKDNVNTIADEYGNQWSEITIDKDRDLATILLQKDRPTSIPLSNASRYDYYQADLLNDRGEIRLMDEAEMKSIVKKNNNNPNSKWHFNYSSQGQYKNKLGKLETRFRVFLANKPGSQQSEGLLKKDIVLDIVSNPTKFSEQNLSETDSKTYSSEDLRLFDIFVLLKKKWANMRSKYAYRTAFEIARMMSRRFGVKFEIDTFEELSKLYPGQLSSTDKGFYVPGTKTAYLIDGNFDSTTAIHEIFTHGFLIMIKNNPDFPGLYESLLEEASRNEKFATEIRDSYKEYSSDVQDDEIIANYFDMILETKLPSNALSAFYKAITRIVKQLFGVDSIVDEIKPTTTLAQLSDFVLFGRGEMSIVSGQVASQVRSDLVSNTQNDLITAWQADFDAPTSDIMKRAIEEELDSTKEINSIKREIQFTQILLKKAIVNVSKSDILPKFINFRQEIKTGLKAQYALMTRSKNVNKVAKDELRSLIMKIDTEEQNILAYRYVKYALDELKKIKESLDAMTSRMNNDEDIDSAALNNSKTDFIDMYDKSLNMMSTLLNNRTELSESLTEDEITELETIVGEAKKVLAKINPIYDTLFDYALARVYAKEASQVGDVGIKDVIQNNLYSIDKDSGWLFSLFGVQAFSRVTQMRALINKVTVASESARVKFELDPDIAKLNSLVKQAKKDFGKKINTMYNPLYEYAKTGKRTGYLVSKLKYGEFLGNLQEFQKNLDEKYKVAISGDLPELDEERIAYLEEKNKFLELNAERMFVAEYYRLRNQFSLATIEALDIHNTEIRKILDKYIDENGVLHTENMSGLDYKNLIASKMAKANLANPIGRDNEFKVGAEKKMADEVAAFNLAIKDKLKYTVNQAAFDAEYKRVLDTKGEEAAKEWKGRNSRKEFDPKFYEELESLSKAEQTQEYKDTYDKRKNILKRFKHPDLGFIMYNMMTPEDLLAVRNLDAKLNSLRKKKSDEEATEEPTLSSKLKESNEFIDTRNKYRSAAESLAAIYRNSADAKKRLANAAKLSAEGKRIEASDIVESIENDIANIKKNHMAKFNKENTIVLKFSDGVTKRVPNSKWTGLTTDEYSQLESDGFNSSKKNIINPLSFDDVAEIKVIPAFEKKRDEAKQLGIKMADEFMKSKQTLNRIANAETMSASDKAAELSKIKAEADSIMRAPFDEFNRLNTVVLNYGGSTSKRIPSSVWTIFEPANKEYIKYNPNFMWSTIDSNSEFYNKNYDESLAENGYQPKASKYDNTAAFNKVMNDPFLKEMHETILNINKKANAKYYYSDRWNQYRLSQMSGGFADKLRGRDGFLKNLGNMFLDGFTSEVDDIQYGAFESDNIRANGTKLKFIPTSFKSMLRDPATISSNLPLITAMLYAKAMQFEALDGIKSEAELMLNGIKQTRVEVKDKNSTFTQIKNVLLGKANESEENNSRYSNKILRSMGGFVERISGVNRDVTDASLTNLSMAASKYMDINMYGVSHVVVGGAKVTPNGDRRWNLAKAGRGLLKWASMANLTGNAKAIAGNFMGALESLSIEAFAGHNITKMSLAKAQKECLYHSISFAQKLFHPSHEDKIVSLMQTLGITSEAAENLEYAIGNSKVKRVLRNLAYGPYTAGDFIVKSQLVVAYLLEHKLYDGEFIHRNEFLANYYPGGKEERAKGEETWNNIPNNMYDAFDMNGANGSLRVKPEFLKYLPDEKISEVGRRCDRVAKKCDGAITKYDKGVAHQTMLGAALTMHRQYLTMAMSDRMHQPMYNYEQGAITEGMFNSLYSASKTKILLMLGKGLSDMDMEMRNNPYRRYNLRRAWLELAAMFISTSAALILGNLKFDEDDDDDKNKRDKEISKIDFAYTTAVRVAFERNALWNPLDTYDLIRDPIASQTFLDNMLLTAGLTFNPEQRDRDLQSGPYKGYSKWTQAAIKASPLRSTFELMHSESFDPQIDNMLKNIGPVYWLMEKFIPSKQEDKEILNRQKKDEANRKKEENKARVEAIKKQYGIQ